MKTLRNKIILAVAALLISIPALAAPVSVGVEADFASRYIWRGFDVYGNGGAFQPSGFVTYAPTDAMSVTGSVWASYMHIHALGTPEWARAFTSLARAWRPVAAGRRTMDGHGNPPRKKSHGLAPAGA